MLATDLDPAWISYCRSCKRRPVGEGFLHQVPDSQLPRQFVLAYPRMSMHEHAGGLGLRQWHRYAHTGFVGMWSLSYKHGLSQPC